MHSRLIVLLLVSLAFIISACGKSGDSSDSEGTPIDSNGDGVIDGYDIDGDGIIDSGTQMNSSGRTAYRYYRNGNNTNNGNSNNSGSNNSGNSNNSNNNSNTNLTSIDRPLPLSAAELDSLKTETGVTNSRSNPVFVKGTVQLWRVKGCKTANVEIRWASGEQWVTYHHFFFESVPNNGNWGAGANFPINLFLPPGGAVRVRDDTNPDCAPGVANADGVINDGDLWLGHANSFDGWTFSNVR